MRNENIAKENNEIKRKQQRRKQKIFKKEKDIPRTKPP